MHDIEDLNTSLTFLQRFNLRVSASLDLSLIGRDTGTAAYTSPTDDDYRKLRNKLVAHFHSKFERKLIKWTSNFILSLYIYTSLVNSRVFGLMNMLHEDFQKMF